MRRLALVPMAVILATLTPVGMASGLRADPGEALRAGVYRNWAGYIAHGGPFASVSTTWTEPSISCASSERSSFASFAGLDGSGSPTVEQIGTIADCSNGRVSHVAFFEMFPKPAFAVNKPVRAGDSLTATVVSTGSKTFTLSLADHTANWSFSTQEHSRRAQLASAEAITEAPTLKGSGVQPLANFNTVNYSGTAANGQPLASFSPEAATMVNRSSVVKAAPSGISGGSFSVTWHHS